MDWARWAWLAVTVLSLPAFADSAQLTFRQSYLASRARARLALFALEGGATAAWLALRYLCQADRPFVPERLAAAAAVCGLALTAAGAGLAVWAKRRLGRWFTMTFAVKPGHELVTDGPYAITRNPIYTGLIAVAAGTALVWDSALAVALTAVYAASFALHAREEEALLDAHFGEAFRAYRRRVPRLLPWPRPRHG